jgi:chromosomal replication initiator protein
MQKEKVWDEIVGEISRNISEESLISRFSCLKLKSLEKDTIIIETPNSLISDWISQNYSDQLSTAVNAIIGRKVGFIFEVNPELMLSSTEPDSGPGTVKRVAGHEYRAETVHAGLAKKYTFESFVTGRSNRFAWAACKAVAEKKANNYNPLFISGGVGLGKTHLLNAVGNELLKRNPRLRVICIQAETFMNDMIRAIRNDKMDAFRRRFRKEIDVLLIDDIEIIAGKERTQEEYYYTFNNLYLAGKKIVIASARFPRDMEALDERIKSRFESGIIADIQPPDFDTRMAILRFKARKEKIQVPEEVFKLLAEHIRSNIHKLEGSLIKLSAASSLYGCSVTVQLAEEMLHSIFDENQAVLSPETVMKAVAECFNVKISELKSKKRNRKFTLPRHIAMYLCRELCKMSFPEIGRSFGNRDHSTVMHACKKIGIEQNTDFELRRHLNVLSKKLDTRNINKLK